MRYTPVKRIEELTSNWWIPYLVLDLVERSAKCELAPPDYEYSPYHLTWIISSGISVQSINEKVNQCLDHLESLCDQYCEGRLLDEYDIDKVRDILG
jgi:hypothetical protein